MPTAAVRAGAPDLTVPMPVLAYEKQILKTMMCALVCGACIGRYLSLYRSVFDCIGLVVVNVFAFVLARIENQSDLFGQYLHVALFHTYQIPTQYMPIHDGIYWHVLQYITIRVLCIWHVLWYVLQYILSLYLHVLQFNTNVIPTQYMPIQIGMY